MNEDLWISIEMRKPTLANPAIEVKREDGTTEEGCFWVSHYRGDFAKLQTRTPDSRITHWREKAA